jgi:hypothetical protein
MTRVCKLFPIDTSAIGDRFLRKIVGSVRPKVQAALWAGVAAGNYQRLTELVSCFPPHGELTMKIMRPLLSFVLFLQLGIALQGQNTVPSRPVQSGFPTRFGFSHGRVGGAAADGQMRAAIASVPLFF